MTLDEKVGQLVVPGPERRLHARPTATPSERLERLVREGRVGGLPRLRRQRGAAAGAAQPRLRDGRAGARSRATRSRSPRCSTGCSAPPRCRCCSPPTSRAAPATSWRGRRACRARWRIGATRDEGLAERAGRLGAGEGRALGVHVDFYPVVDVNVNPQNPIINIRSFGEDPELVARMATAYMRGIQAGRHAGDRQAFPRPRRHRDRHPPRPRGHRAPARAARRGGARAVPGRDRRRHRRRHVLAHPPAGARPDRGPAGDAQPADPDRPAAPGAGLRRGSCSPTRCRCTRSASASRRSRRRRWRSGPGPTWCSTRPTPRRRCAGSGEAVERGEIPREQVDRSVERILARQGAARASTAPARVDVEAVPARVGGPRAPGGGGRDRLARDHAAEGRARPGAAAAAAERARAAAVGDRLRERLARGRARGAC